MNRLILRVGLVGLIAASLGSQGCIVPWAKYQDLKKKHGALVGEVESKDRQIQDLMVENSGLRDELKTKDQVIRLYEDKKRDAERIAAQASARADELQGKIDKLARRLGPDAEPVPGGIALKDRLLFALGSAEISEKGQKALQDIAAEFKGTEVIIRIDGHTDDHRVARRETIEKFVDNWGLASARANAVLRLLAKFGIPERNMHTRAYSMHKPRVPNTSEANRAQNRRVEVMFLPREAIEGKKAEPGKEG